jgi:magnesium-transporting ATPase (P-type)
MSTADPVARAPAPDPPAPPGLTSVEAAARLAQAGPNRLPATRPVPAWRRFGAQLVHFFALMLWVAGALAFVAGMPQLGVAIFVIILVNATFAFAQEHRAENAAERLRDLLPRRATVIRDGGPLEIDAEALVAGDLVLLRAGDRISADLRTTEAHSLAIDTSMLTGESVPARAGAQAALYAGTFVVEGEGLATVLATGGATRLAGIARLTRAGQRPPSPLVRELGRVVRTIAAIAVAVGVAFFAVALLVGLPLGAGFLFAIGVTVALVPEGLLPTVTLSLALGAQRMAGRHALVRRLESVEPRVWATLESGARRNMGSGDTRIRGDGDGCENDPGAAGWLQAGGDDAALRRPAGSRRPAGAARTRPDRRASGGGGAPGRGGAPLRRLWPVHPLRGRAGG